MPQAIANFFRSYINGDPVLFLTLFLLTFTNNIMATPSVDLQKFVVNNLEGKSMGGALVYVDEENEFIIPFGYAAEDQPFDKDSIFNLASLSKAFAGTLAAILADAGTIDLNQKLSDALPNLESLEVDRKQQVILRQLLTHTSGLPRHDFSFIKRELTSQELLDNFRHLGFATLPGTAWIYSNLGFFLMQEIIKDKLGLSYIQALRTHLLEPLNIKAFKSIVAEDLPSKQLALPHVKTANGFIALPVTDMVKPAEAAGSLSMSARQMAKWMKFQIGQGNQKLVTLNQTFQFSPWVQVSDQEAYSGYSLGWVHAKAPDTQQTIWHNGGVEGYQTFLSFSPSKKQAVGIFLNSNLAELDKIGMSLYEQITKLPLSLGPPESPVPPRTLSPQPLPAKLTLFDFTGRFSNPAYGEVVVTFEDKKFSASFNKWFSLTELIHTGDLIFKQQGLQPSIQDLFKIEFVQGGLTWTFEAAAGPIFFQNVDL